MIIEQVVFYIFAAMLIAAGLMVITSRNPVRGVLFLVLAFFASAGLWILLEAEFLALILVVVYVGAVMTLFLFIVMMLDIDVTPKHEGFVRFLPIGILVMAVLVGLMIMTIIPKHFGLADIIPAEHATGDYSNVQGLGMVLYTTYMYPFELAGVLLLVAIIAAITLAFRGKSRSRHQRPFEQISTRPQDRIRIVKMKSEKFD